MEIEQLREMKRQMVRLGNWKEVKRINKMIDFHNQQLQKRPKHVSKINCFFIFSRERNLTNKMFCIIFLSVDQRLI